jgi:4-amino-4-deoxy-L-arabinose transferase-like glycosyltransferase
MVALVAAALALALLLPGLGAAPFDDPGEGQHAEIAREAWRSGDWLTLRLNGVRYFDKPPLLYLLQAGAFATWGVSEWAARLAPLAGAVLAVAATAGLGARLLGPGGGLLAGAALLACPFFYAFARYVRPETLFLACIQWGFVGLAAGVISGSRAGAVLGCAALGMAVLAKDLLGLVGPLAALAGALALAGRLRPVRAWLPPLGLAALVVIGAGWPALATWANPGSLWYTVVDNHLRNAALIRLFPDEDVPLALGEFLAAAGMGAFPWIVPAALMVWTLARRRAWRDPQEIAWLALALWGAGLLVLFAVVPFRLPHYGLPAYGAFALLAARWWYERRDGARGAALLHAALLGLAAAACALAAASDGRLFGESVLAVSDPTARKATIHQQLGLAGEVSAVALWPAFAALLAKAAVVLGVGAAALAALAGLRRAAVPAAAAAAIVAVTMLATLPLVGEGLRVMATSRAVDRLGAELAARARPGDFVVHEGPIEASGALELYSGRRPALLDGTRSVLGFGATFADARDTFWTAERFKEAWLSSGRTTYLVTPRAPERSVIAGLPPDRVRLVLGHNGRRLYVSAGAPQPSR